MNYLEELMNWHFRFNGYFLISDYVNHQTCNSGKTKDSDLLGIRLPYVKEEIGGQERDFDDRIISNTKIVCVIGQAKSGPNINRRKVSNNQKTIKQNIYRFGIFNDDDMIERVVRHLLRNNTYENETHKIIRVFISEKTYEDRRFINIKKDEIIEGIKRRKERYRKTQDRLFFNSELIQYLFSIDYDP
jgi:hypothetical protein